MTDATPRIKISRAKAFTLVETLLVVAAVGVLAAIVILAINPSRQIAQAHNSRRWMDVNAILNAANQYALEHGSPPSGIDENMRMIGTATSGCALSCGQQLAVLDSADELPGFFDKLALNDFSQGFIAHAAGISGESAEQQEGILSASVNPSKVYPGDKVTLRAVARDPSGIDALNVDMGGIETINLNLTEGDVRDGVWQADWIAHDTEEKNYSASFSAVSKSGKEYSRSVPWSDPISGWISPSSTSDPGNQWTNEPNTYDGNLITYGSNNYGGTGWGQYIYFNLATSTYVNRVRINADYLDAIISQVQIDVYRDGAWTTVFTGGNEAQWNAQWVEISFAAGNVTQARFRYNYAAGGYYFWVYEFQFYQTVPVVTLPTCTTQPATLIQDTVATLHGYVTDDGGEPVQYQFQYGLTTSYGTDSGWVSAAAAGEYFNQFISGLTPSTNYHFQAQVKNSVGTANCGDQLFRTSSPLVGWVSPTGFSDPSNAWENETNVYDNNIVSYARSYHAINATQWSEFVYYTHDPMTSDRIRLIGRAGSEVDQVEVGVFKDGAWVTVYTGAFTDQAWYEIGYSSGLVSQARIRFHATAANHGFYWQLYEVDFQQSSETSNESCLDLTGLVPTYIGGIPIDPVWGSDQRTYYGIKKDPSGSNRLTVYACTPELQADIHVLR